jgi:hypothetical protein
MNEPTLRDRLLVAEPPNADLERRFRERLRQITERRLAPVERAGLAIPVLGTLALIVWFIRLMSPYPPGRPEIGLLALRIGIVLAGALGACAVVLIVRGRESLRRDGTALTLLVLGSTLVMVGLLMWKGLHLPDPVRGNREMLVALLVWCLAGIPFCVSMFVRTSEIKLRTDLLRLELALAELGESQRSRPE